jgi:hypothetical protein
LLEGSLGVLRGLIFAPPRHPAINMSEATRLTIGNEIMFEWIYSEYSEWAQEQPKLEDEL